RPRDRHSVPTRRSSDLRPTDVCVNYALCLDSAPEETQIYINGEKVGVYQPPGPGDPPFTIDVTPYVALEYNEIAFRVEWNAAGQDRKSTRLNSSHVKIS